MGDKKIDNQETAESVRKEKVKNTTVVSSAESIHFLQSNEDVSFIPSITVDSAELSNVDKGTVVPGDLSCSEPLVMLVSLLI